MISAEKGFIPMIALKPKPVWWQIDMGVALMLILGGGGGGQCRSQPGRQCRSQPGRQGHVQAMQIAARQTGACAGNVDRNPADRECANRSLVDSGECRRRESLLEGS